MTIISKLYTILRPFLESLYLKNIDFVIIRLLCRQPKRGTVLDFLGEIQVYIFMFII